MPLPQLQHQRCGPETFSQVYVPLVRNYLPDGFTLLD